MKTKKFISIFLVTTLISTLICFPLTTDADEISTTTLDTKKDNSLAVYKSATGYVDNTENRKIYNAIYNDLLLRKTFTTLTMKTPFSNSEVNADYTIFHKVLADHPELFYVSNNISAKYDSDAKLILNYTYIFDSSAITIFNNKINYIIRNLITSNMTQLEKEIAIHDYIVSNTAYSTTKTSASYTAYGPIINKNGVCEGYSKAMKVLLNKAGIECEIISSEDMNHAWNIVTIDGSRYHVDATWDDSVPDKGSTINYTYFNQSDSIMKDKNHNHYWNYNSYKTCTSDKYKYFSTMRDGFRLGNTIYYTDSSNYSFNSVNINGKNCTNLSRSYMFKTTYHNGWIYCSYNKNLVRVKLNDTSIMQKLKTNVQPNNIYFKNGQVYYTNGLTSTTEHVTIPNYNEYDFNGDGHVNIADLSELASNYNKTSLSIFLNGNEDITNDEFIDIYDICKLSSKM